MSTSATVPSLPPRRTGVGTMLMVQSEQNPPTPTGFPRTDVRTTDLKDTTLSRRKSRHAASFRCSGNGFGFACVLFPPRAAPDWLSHGGLHSCGGNCISSGVFHAWLPHPGPMAYHL